MLAEINTRPIANYAHDRGPKPAHFHLAEGTHSCVKIKSHKGIFFWCQLIQPPILNDRDYRVHDVIHIELNFWNLRSE